MPAGAGLAVSGLRDHPAASSGPWGFESCELTTPPAITLVSLNFGQLVCGLIRFDSYSAPSKYNGGPSPGLLVCAPLPGER